MYIVLRRKCLAIVLFIKSFVLQRRFRRRLGLLKVLIIATGRVTQRTALGTSISADKLQLSY